MGKPSLRFTWGLDTIKNRSLTISSIPTGYWVIEISVTASFRLEGAFSTG